MYDVVTSVTGITSDRVSESYFPDDDDQLELNSLSNVVMLGNRYHVLIGQKLTDNNTGGTRAQLRHRWVEFTDVAQFSGVTGLVVSDNQSDGVIRPALVNYRNKLVAAYTRGNGLVESARFDNLDPSEHMWIPYGLVEFALSNQAPTLQAVDQTSYLAQQQYSTENYGNDLHVVVVDSESKSPITKLLSRHMMRQDIDQNLALYDSESGTCNNREDHVLIDPLTMENRPILTEIGMNFWMYPRPFIKSLYSGYAEWMCSSDGDWESSEFQCQSKKLPVIIKPHGGLFICGGAYINRDSDYLNVWEELGHYAAGAISISGSLSDVGIVEEISEIESSAILQAREIFRESINECDLNGTRCSGFTGIANNYDSNSVSHSFIYAVQFYLTRGNDLRNYIRQDLRVGNNLLSRKYNWLKRYLFNGVEFQNNMEPI